MIVFSVSLCIKGIIYKILNFFKIYQGKYYSCG